MKLDETTKEACIEIQRELKEDGVDISIQEIAEIVSSQLKVANIGFKKGLNVRLPFFGSYIRKFGVEKGTKAATLNDLKDTMTTEEFEEKVLEAKLANKKQSKERRKEDRNTQFTLEDLKNTPNLVKSKNKYDNLA